MIRETLNNQGLKIEAVYTQKELEEVFQPLLEKMTALRKEKGKRMIIYLAAPPGAGKTTLALILEKLYNKNDMPFTFQSLAMDGFHHTNDYLKNHYTTQDGHRTPLKVFKGKPETFDLKGLKKALNALKSKEAIEWPIYSRALHDVALETRTINADILLLEGNYLLLDQEGWADLAEYADFTIFLSAPIELLKGRLIERKQQGDHSMDEALAHYERVDLPNYHLVMKHSYEADCYLVLNDKEEWEFR